MLFLFLIVLSLLATIYSIPTYVMLPLAIFDNDGNFLDKDGLDSQLAKLASGGVCFIPFPFSFLSIHPFPDT